MRFEVTPFLSSSNARSAGGSVIETIEAESLSVCNHHINILLLHVFLASDESRLTVSKHQEALRSALWGPATSQVKTSTQHPQRFPPNNGGA